MLTATQLVRHLEAGELLPPELRSGFESARLDRDWVWVFDDGGIKAVLVVAPAHGVCHVMRVCATHDAPKTAILRLLREARLEARDRGYVGIIVFLEASTKADMKLARIAEKFGLKALPRIGFWCGGKL